MVSSVASSAGCQSSLSTLTSTRSMPTFCAQATPPNLTEPDLKVWKDLGTSMRDENLIGASAS